MAHKHPTVLTLCATALYLLALYELARCTLRGLGDKPSLTAIVALTLTLGYLCASRKTFLWLVLPASILAALYTPVGLVFGAPNFQYLISLWSTDPSEAAEFLSQIELRIYLRGLRPPALACVCWLLATKAHLQPWKNKTVVLITVLCLMALVAPSAFLSKTFTAIQETREQLRMIADPLNRTCDWGESRYTGPEQKDYVLVIGESVRRDYMQLYGYPVADTPFLSHAPAHVVEGLSAADIYTVGSLRLMLTQGDTQNWKENYNRTIIDLAKSAGFETHWISNQGYIGKWDTPITSIAMRAHEAHFVKKLDYDILSFSNFYTKNPVP